MAFRGIFDNVILENTVYEDNKIQVIRLTRLGCVEGYHIDSAGKIGEKASIDSVDKNRVYANCKP